MRNLNYFLLSISAAVVLAACGGGAGEQKTKITYSSMVTFGDSLSDVGTYKVGAIAATGGGKYTVNSATTKNWTELIAAQLGLSAPCAAQKGLDGLGGSAQFTVMPPTNQAGCLNYAQGGARVTESKGPGNKALEFTPTGGTSNGYATLGQLTVPLVTQVANHFTATARTTFAGTELITVAGGANDVFTQLQVLQALGGGNTAIALAAGWTGADLVAVGGGTSATALAVTKMGTAGTELANLVKNEMVAKGAKYILVATIPDMAQTPFGLSQDAGTRALIGSMVTTFNTNLKAGLAGAAGVVVVDAYAANQDQIANPGQHGLTNVTTPSCGATGNILGLNALTCTTTNVNPALGDVSKYLFSDSVHPSPYGYQLLAQLVTSKMTAAGWL